MTVSRRLLAFVAAGVLVAPAMLILGSQGASRAEFDTLKTENETLRLENDSYRQATGELTEQISSMQSALVELGEQAQLDPATRGAIERATQVIRSRSVGGGPNGLRPAAVPSTPESTFGVLRDLLGSLEDGLASVKTRVQTQQAFVRAAPTTWPIVGWLSSLYGNRKDPFTGAPDFHPGLDISAVHGTTIKATADGTIEAAGFNGAYGNSVTIAHGFGIATRYGHMSQVGVRPGQRVKRGEVIGYVGATGRATSPHLHYEILVNGQPINPLRILTRP